MKIGFIGLGQMGKHMAINLLKSNAQLIVASRSDKTFPEFQKRGVRTTQDLMEVTEADIIFLCLPNSQIVYETLLGEKGIVKKLLKGQIVIDTSTINYRTAVEIANCLEEKGISFLDAPISGMEARAKDGTLTVMCGGKYEVFEEVKPYLDLIGNNILYMGKSGHGQLTKLINQLLFNINVAALAEILPMSVKLGLEPEKLSQVVNSGTGRSYASEFFIPKILKNSFLDGYAMNKAYKDLVSAAEISSEHCIPLPVLNAAKTTYQMALLKGYGESDKGGMVRVFEDLLGVKYREE